MFDAIRACLHNHQCSHSTWHQFYCPIGPRRSIWNRQWRWGGAGRSDLFTEPAEFGDTQERPAPPHSSSRPSWYTVNSRRHAQPHTQAMWWGGSTSHKNKNTLSQRTLRFTTYVLVVLLCMDGWSYSVDLWVKDILACSGVEEYQSDLDLSYFNMFFHFQVRPSYNRSCRNLTAGCILMWDRWCGMSMAVPVKR